MWLEPAHSSREPNVIMGRSSSGSEVVMLDDRVIEAAAQSQPAVTNLNVTSSSRVHIGPKFVSVTQNVENTSVVKGRILGLELVSPQNAKRLRCSIAVFVCWAIIAASGLTFFIVYFALAKSPTRLDIGLNATWYLRRADWLALKDTEKTLLKLPVAHVIIGHSATEACNERYECIKKVLAIQRDHLERYWQDIGPNYLVGGEGLVFEGRGANLLGVMSASWNRVSISVMFLGNYIHNEPRQEQFDHVNILLKLLVEIGVLRADYIVYGQCQVMGGVITPGPNIMDNLYKLEHWNPVNKTSCLHLPIHRYIWDLVKNTTKAERISCGVAMVILIVCIILIVYFIEAAKNTVQTADVAPHEWYINRTMWLAPEFDTLEKIKDFDPLRLVIVAHSVSATCPTFEKCAAEMRNLQDYFIKEYQYNLPYNFLIGNDGRVYEGRGWNTVGAHTYGYNRCSMGLAFIGDYREGSDSYTKVTELQLQRAQMLFQEGVRLKYLHDDFKVIGAKDVKSTLSPGTNLYNAIRKWPNYAHKNIYRDRTCEEIYANFSFKNTTTTVNTTKVD